VEKKSRWISSSKATALVPPQLGDERPDLREWFQDVARTEQNHDLFCVKDLKELGLDPVLLPGFGAGLSYAAQVIDCL
jgi:hypothetical protein